MPYMLVGLQPPGGRDLAPDYDIFMNADREFSMIMDLLYLIFPGTYRLVNLTDVWLGYLLQKEGNMKNVW